MILFLLWGLLNSTFLFASSQENDTYVPRMDIIEQQITDPVTGDKITVIEIKHYIHSNAESSENSAKTTYYITDDYEHLTPTHQQDSFQFIPSIVPLTQFNSDQIFLTPETVVVTPCFSDRVSYTQQKVLFEQLTKNVNNFNEGSILVIDQEQHYQQPVFQPFDTSFVPAHAFDRGAQYLRQVADVFHANAPCIPITLLLKNDQNQWIPIPHTPCPFYQCPVQYNIN